MSQTLRGSLYIIASCLIWSFGSIAAKFYLNYLPAIPTAVINALCAALAVFLLQPQLGKDLVAAFRKSPREFLAFGLIGVGLGSIGYNLALSEMTVSMVASLVRLQPLFILFMAGIWLKERLRGSQYLFILTAAVGTIFLLWPQIAPLFSGGEAPELLPLLFMLISILGYAAVTVQGKALTNQGHSPSVLIILRFGLGGLICLPFLFTAPLAAYVEAPWWAWLIVPANAVLSTALGFILYYRGLPHVSASLSAFVEQMFPVFTILLGTIILHESLLWVQYLGTAILLVSMGMLGWLEHRAKLLDLADDPHG